jgi:hypothetical protein
MDILKRQFPIKSLIFLKSNCHAKMAPDTTGRSTLMTQLMTKDVLAIGATFAACARMSGTTENHGTHGG